MTTELSVSRNRIESVLPLLGAELTDDEYIRDIESGEILTTEDGKELPIDDIGYIASGDNGELVPVEDDTSSIIAALTDRNIRDD